MILLFSVSLLLQVVCGQQFVQRTMPESNETFSAEQWSQIVEKLQPQVDTSAKPLKQPASSGKLSHAIAGQIIGGSAAVRGQFPWQACIIIDNAYLCGGSLILTNWVLTAAHCAEDSSKFSVTLGSVDRSATPADAVTIATTSKYVHEKYEESNLNNDIALLKLPQQVTLNAFVNTIKLPAISDGGKSFEGLLATISGFGKTSDYSSASKDLNFVQVSVISNTQCAQVYGPSIVLASNICTKQADKSTCQGDSGGPLVFRDNSNTWVQIGIVSFGSSKGCLYGPSGYTRVASYLGWVSEKVGQDVAGSPVNYTMPTTAPTSSTSIPPTNKPIKCSPANFSNLRRNCCLELPYQDLILPTQGEKICGKMNLNSMKVALNAFNVYTLNKQQNAKLNHMVNFNDTKTQKKLLKDACFVDCYLKAKEVVVNDVVDLEVFQSFITNNQDSSYWIEVLNESAEQCLSKHYTNRAITSFSDGRNWCDGRLLMVAQCVQQKLVSKCPRITQTAKCATDYILFKQCAPLISQSESGTWQ